MPADGIIGSERASTPIASADRGLVWVHKEGVVHYVGEAAYGEEYACLLHQASGPAEDLHPGAEECPVWPRLDPDTEAPRAHGGQAA